MGKKMQPRIKTGRVLFEVKWEINKKTEDSFDPGVYAIVLCNQCLKKRRSKVTWNRSSYGTREGRYIGYEPKPPDQWYGVGRPIGTRESAECRDCKFKYKSVYRLRISWWDY